MTFTPADTHDCKESTYSGAWIYLYNNKWYMDVETTAAFVIIYCPFCGAWLDVEKE